MLGFGKKKTEEKKQTVSEEVEVLKRLKDNGWEIGGIVSKEGFEKLKESGYQQRHKAQ